MDNTAPAVALTGPADGALVRQTVSLQAAASDADLDHVEFFIDGADEGAGTLSGGAWSFALDTAALADGSHSWGAQAVNRAVAESESRDLATILKAAQSQWQAAAWRLERRFPEKYGRNDRLKVDAKIEHDGASLLTKLARLIDGDAEPKKRGRPPKETPE